MYVYISSEPGLWTVGFYGPNGWVAESDHKTAAEAADRVILLNGGGQLAILRTMLRALSAGMSGGSLNTDDVFNAEDVIAYLEREITALENE